MRRIFHVRGLLLRISLFQLSLWTDFHHPCKELDAYSGKVHNLLWSSNHDFTRRHLFSCGPDGQITWWNILVCHDRDPVFEVSALCSFVLPPSKQRWASAVVVLPNPYTEQSVGEDVWTVKSFVVVCGDRKGSLHLFHPENGDLPSEKVILCMRFSKSLHMSLGFSVITRGYLFHVNLPLNLIAKLPPNLFWNDFKNLPHRTQTMDRPSFFRVKANEFCSKILKMHSVLRGANLKKK